MTTSVKVEEMQAQKEVYQIGRENGPGIKRAIVDQVEICRFKVDGSGKGAFTMPRHPAYLHSALSIVRASKHTLSFHTPRICGQLMQASQNDSWIGIHRGFAA